MATSLKGKKVAFLATDGVEQVELTEPWKALEDAGAELHLVSLKGGSIQMMKHDDKGDTFPVDKTVAEASSSDYAMLLLPGGVANGRAERVGLSNSRERLEKEFGDDQAFEIASAYGSGTKVQIRIALSTGEVENGAGA